MFSNLLTIKISGRIGGKYNMNRSEAIRILGETKICSPLGNAAHVAIAALDKQSILLELLEEAAEEIENCYGGETQLSKRIRQQLD